MADEIVAYSEITILDLIDTATYIYYAEDENGTGAQSAPTSNTKYIGIYSGPPIEGGQPIIPPAGTQWTKYVGDKGDKGDNIYITSTSINYVTSTSGTITPSSGWKASIPTLNKGEYLWTRTIVNYSDGTNATSYSVSYSGIDGEDGKDANTYYIETNQEEILKFETQTGISFSPENFTFKVYENPKQINSPQLALTANDYCLEILNGSNFEQIVGEFLSLGFVQSTDSGTVIVDEKTVYFNLPDFWQDRGLLSSNQIFRFSFLQNSKVVAIKIIQLRNGVSDEMARLNLHASGIDASIQSGKLSFSAEGLILYENDERVFWSQDGNLWLKGNLEAAGGTFSGELRAASGSFEGEITAKSGSIGGLTISENALYSGSDLNSSPLKIQGTGEVYAQNIVLGNKASIENQIQLGNAYIKNPDNHEGIFLEAGRISLSEDGKFKLGDIEAYGGNNNELSYIKAGNNTSFWQINGNGTAQFKEIVVDKATIKNSIMESGTVQAVGSLMLFKDSWKVENVTEVGFILESAIDDINLEAEDIITDGSNYYKIQTVDGKTITLKNGVLTSGQIVTKMGKTEDFLMAILGDETGEKDYAVKNSLTVSKIINSTGEIPVFKRTLVLGDLTSINSSYGTGLYAENVFLNGTLTTQVGNTSYAGVNTLSGAVAKQFGEEDESKIVFWAGSEGTSVTDIQEAKFQVTEAGSIYAAQGRFKGSIITDSVIKGASIHTAKIYGEDGQGQAAALQIFDAARGIQFIKSEELGEVQLGIGTDGLYIGQNKLFISLIDGIKYYGQEAIYSNDSSIVFIRPDFIGFDSNIESINPTWKIRSDSSFSFTNNDNLIFEIKNNSVRSTQKVNFENNITFGKGETGILDYQTTSNGYNLYVR